MTIATSIGPHGVTSETFEQDLPVSQNKVCFAGLLSNLHVLCCWKILPLAHSVLLAISKRVHFKNISKVPISHGLAGRYNFKQHVSNSIFFFMTFFIYRWEMSEVKLSVSICWICCWNWWNCRFALRIICFGASQRGVDDLRSKLVLGMSLLNMSPQFPSVEVVLHS